MPEPADPFSGIGEAAVGIHEMFASLVAAGFREDQALHMVTTVLATLISGSAGG